MKLSYLRASAILAATLGLAACGGKQSFDVSGVIIGLTQDGLKLSNNGEILEPKKGATSFTFSQRADYGQNYDIRIEKSAQHMQCGISGNTGSAGHYTSISAVVSCILNSNSLSGTVEGLPPGQIIRLANGTVGTVDVTGGADASKLTPFAFAAPVYYDAPYNVQVVPIPPIVPPPATAKPLTVNCTVSAASGAGIMPDGPVKTLEVKCTPK
ncbi:hypothetical protein [Janthinobacterium fluminis]|uniref:Lipoprotein n=1 Tax=Janthinobacterium fluminis TaxID=2987524 RepID=A0ABT5K3D4_9BURK|nr:hypothetical protein [Janthinobacterium fluminis]MDC8759489.1 hypothetical protein [Janthinobacterium fluminis]